MDELELLRSYENGPRIWDAAAVVPEVWALEKKGLIEKFDPEDGRRYRLTEAGRAALKPADESLAGERRVGNGF
jgi:DNA-binding PadR family transcriptional regulator